MLAIVLGEIGTLLANRQSSNFSVDKIPLVHPAVFSVSRYAGKTRTTTSLISDLLLANPKSMRFVKHAGN
jgi:hypothetical protein